METTTHGMRLRALRIAWPGLVAGIALCGGLGLLPAAQAACNLVQMQIPVRMVNHRPVATVSLNGTPVQMLVDSGAFYSFLTPSTAAQLNLRLRRAPEGLQVWGYTGRVYTQVAQVERLGLRNAEVPNVEFLVGGNEIGSGIQGLIGRNILAVGDAEYDLAHGLVSLSFPKGECKDTPLAYWAGEAPVIEVPLPRGANDSKAIRVPVKINGKSMLALMDTGAPTTALALGAARSAGIAEGDLQDNGRTGGAGQGWARSWTGPVALFELGGQKIANSRLEVNDVSRLDQDLVLGLDYLLGHRIYVSYLQRKVYITWNGGPVFVPGAGGEGAYDPRYAALPQEVASDDADALARRGAAAIASGQHARALEDLNRACELAPQEADHFHTRARLHLAMKQPQLALADLDRVLQLDQGVAEARNQRAALRVGMKDLAGARADLEHLDRSLPPSSALRAGMGDLFVHLGDTAQALKQFGLWLDTHPRDAARARHLNSRCWLRARLNMELPLALTDCKEAVDADDKAAHYRDSLGWTYLRLGEAAKARAAFDAAIELKPLAFSHFGRALAWRRLGDAAQAERDLAAARQLEAAVDARVRREGFDFADLPAP